MQQGACVGVARCVEDVVHRAAAGLPFMAVQQDRLPVRERVALLLDSGSFSEDALLANWESAMRSVGSPDTLIAAAVLGSAESGCPSSGSEASEARKCRMRQARTPLVVALCSTSGAAEGSAAGGQSVSV